jgi:hypothetical protein
MRRNRFIGTRQAQPCRNRFGRAPAARSAGCSTCDPPMRAVPVRTFPDRLLEELVADRRLRRSSRRIAAAELACRRETPSVEGFYRRMELEFAVVIVPSDWLTRLRTDKVMARDDLLDDPHKFISATTWQEFDTREIARANP